MRNALQFLRLSAREAARGSRAYYLWMAFLGALVVWGAVGYVHQLQAGLIATNMRDSVSWGFYIGNFTFLVGVAAAAVMLVIPAYLYDWKPIKEVVLMGEALAVSAIVMCLLFVSVDLGRVDRAWHLIPGVGRLNFPASLLSWDVLVLNVYLVVNLLILGFLLHAAFFRKPYNRKIVLPLILFSIPMAVSIHTVTAFIYNGLAARPFWNASILAPRFLVSAFCSGPAILLILFQILERTTRFSMRREAYWKVAEFVAYAIFINLFLFGAEVFKEFYSHTEHIVHWRYYLLGIGRNDFLVPFAWASILLNVAAFVIFLVPRTRKNRITLSLGCLFIYTGVYLEKGIGFIVPGMTPDPLGQIYPYTPSLTEIQVGAGIFGIGFLLFTLIAKIAIAISFGELRAAGAPAGEGEPPEDPAPR